MEKPSPLLSRTAQGAPAGGLPRVVSGASGARDLQSVPGPDSRSPPALLPRRGHARSQSWVAPAAALWVEARLRQRLSLVRLPVTTILPLFQ